MEWVRNIWMEKEHLQHVLEFWGGPLGTMRGEPPSSSRDEGGGDQ